MKKITNLTKQEIHLEGFGFIEIEESLDGIWNVDVFPRGSFNDKGSIRIESTFSGSGDKHFEFPKPKKGGCDCLKIEGEECNH